MITPATHPGIPLRDMMVSNFVLRLSEMQQATEKDFIDVYGPEGSKAFWEDVLYCSQSITSFIWTMSRARAEAWEQLETTKMALESAMMDAFRDDQPWFRGNYKQMESVFRFHDIQKPDEIHIKPKQAVEWLQTHPRWRVNVPQTLRAYLETSPTQSSPTAGTARVKRGGRRPTYDWTMVSKKLGEHFHEVGVPPDYPGAQAELENLVASWFDPDATPSESLIRDKVREALVGYKAGVG